MHPRWLFIQGMPQEYETLLRAVLLLLLLLLLLGSQMALHESQHLLVRSIHFITHAPSLQLRLRLLGLLLVCSLLLLLHLLHLMHLHTHHLLHLLLLHHELVLLLLLLLLL